MWPSALASLTLSQCTVSVDKIKMCVFFSETVGEWGKKKKNIKGQTAQWGKKASEGPCS